MFKIFNPLFSEVFHGLYYKCKDGKRRHVRDIPSSSLVKVCKIYLNHIMVGLGRSRCFHDVETDTRYNDLGTVTASMQLELLVMLKLIDLRVDLRFDQTLFDYRDICRQAASLSDVRSYYVDWNVENFSGYYPGQYPDEDKIIRDSNMGSAGYREKMIALQ